MVRSVDSTLVTADDDELVALKVVVALDGSCMNAVLGAGDAIEAWVLKLTCSPDRLRGARLPLNKDDAPAQEARRLGPAQRL